MTDTVRSVESATINELLAAETPAEVYQTILEAATDRLAADRCVVALERAGELEAVSVVDKSRIGGNDGRLQSPLDYRVLAYQDEGSCLVDDLADTRCTATESVSGGPSLSDETVRSLLCVPLADHGIVFAESTVPAAFSDDDRTWLEQLSTYATAALKRYQSIHPEADSDPSPSFESEQISNPSETAGISDRFDDRASFVLNETGSVLWEIEISDSSLRMYGPIERLYGVESGSNWDLDSFIDEYVHPEDRERVQTVLQSVIQGETGEFEAEYRIQTDPERDARWIKSRAALSDGNEALLVGLSIDITEQKEREWKIKDLQRRITGLIRADSADEIAQVAVDASGKVLDLPMRGVYLHDGDDALEPTAVSDPVYEQFDRPPRYRNGSDEPVDSFVWEVFERGKTKVIEDTDEFERLEATTAAESAIIYPLDDHGVFIVSSTERDAFGDTDVAFGEVVTASMIAALDRAEQERRLREQAVELERKNDRLERFTSIVSHDLRNPLNVALGRIEHLRSQRDDEHLETAETALERMETIIADTLALAQQGLHVDSLEPVALGELVGRCWQNVDTGTTATLQVDFEADSGPSIRADSKRFAHVFENLMVNAVEHGGDDVTIRIGVLSGGNGIYVEDDGPGIPATDRERAFETGFTTSVDGTGFGLSLVEDIVEAHGWSISVTSGVNGGARFEITGIDID